MSGKRANGEGTIYKRRDGRWEGKYTDANGKRRAVYGRTRGEVAKAIAEMVVNGTPTSPLLRDYKETWLNESVAPKAKPSTLFHYRQRITKHVQPTLGDKPIADITPDDVRSLMDTRLANGLSAMTVRHIHAALGKLLSHAVEQGYLTRNVCRSVIPPRATQASIHPLTPIEARAFLTAAQGDRYEALYTLALTTGMRRGELLALKWDDIDIQRKRISVCRAAVSVNGHTHVTTPKSKAGNRTIPLTRAALNAIEVHRERQKPSNPFLFVNTRGNIPAASDILTYSFRPLLERAGLRRIRFHDLRHTCATFLLAEGVHPKIVQEHLGHSDISTTLNIYSHVMPGMSDRAALAIDKILG